MYLVIYFISNVNTMVIVFGRSTKNRQTWRVNKRQASHTWVEDTRLRWGMGRVLSLDLAC